jgi:hypothetical protein
MDEKIKQLAKDLKLIKELQANDIYTANYQEAKALFSLGYRKGSDTAREILKWLVGQRHLFNRTHEIGFEKPRTSYLIESDEIEELAKKYGVDLWD